MDGHAKVKDTAQDVAQDVAEDFLGAGRGGRGGAWRCLSSPSPSSSGETRSQHTCAAPKNFPLSET